MLIKIRYNSKGKVKVICFRRHAGFDVLAWYKKNLAALDMMDVVNVEYEYV